MTTETAPPISPLVADLITGMMAENAQTTNYLIDTLTAQLAERDAELAAIREGVLSLFDGRYMPTPAAVQRALYPTAEQIDAYREGER